MKKLVYLAVSHLAVGAIGFAAGIYVLPILIAAELAAKAPADGYTLLLATTALFSILPCQPAGAAAAPCLDRVSGRLEEIQRPSQ
jgi:hypothetical protein